MSLNLHIGEILGLIGPNGAGKSTLMRCLAGFERPDAEQITVAAGNFRDALFFLPDAVTPYPEASVKATLSLFASAFGRESAAVADAARDLALGAVLDQAAGTLSKGYLRRLLLAIALLAPQPVLLLDEPFDGLDPHQVRAVAGLLRSLVAKRRSLMVSVHQLADAQKVCDRFALLQDGRLLALGSLDSLRAQAGVRHGNLEEVFLALTEPALA